MSEDVKKEATTLFIVRHGETEWNQQGILQGHLDSPLSDLGVRQAKAVAHYFETCDWDLIICSDLKRAVDTAKIIKGLNSRKIITDNQLRERNLGIAQGLTLENFAKKFPDEYKKFNTGGTEFVIKDGESIHERYSRSVKCIQAYADKYAGKKIIVVTHGGILDSAFRHTLQIPLDSPRKFSLFNASINTIKVEGKSWEIVTWGYVEHLRELGSIDDWYRGAI